MITFRQQTPCLWIAEPLPGLLWMIRLTRTGYQVSDGRNWRAKAARHDHLPQAIAAADAALAAAIAPLTQARAA